ncbi:MAG: hypothetical protein WD572_05830 [Gammaproteobacteria bacterium]
MLALPQGKAMKDEKRAHQSIALLLQDRRGDLILAGQQLVIE